MKFPLSILPSTQLALEITTVLALCAIVLMAFPRYRAPRTSPPSPTEFIFSRPETLPDVAAHYPGHFAYASPYGFGVLPSLHAEDAQHVATLQETLSYTPFLEPVAMPRVARSPVAVLPAEYMMVARVQPPQPKAAEESDGAFEVKFSESLAEREFSIAVVMAERLAKIRPSGEVRAEIAVDGQGRVAEVFFTPGHVLRWNELRQIEALLMKGRADKADETTHGVVGIRWREGG